MVLSLTYTLLSSLFNFQYDHKFMVALIMGLGLLFKEYMFDINDWIIRILNRMGTLLQSKVETNNKILTQDTIDKFKRGNITHRPRTLNEYINLEEVNRNNTIQQIIEESKNSHNRLRDLYKNDITSLDTNDNKSMFTDWRFWLLTTSISVTLYLTYLHYFDLPYPTFSGSGETIRTYCSDIFSKIKNYFFRGDGPGDPSGSDHSRIFKGKGKEIISDSPITITNNMSGESTPTAMTFDLPSDPSSSSTVPRPHFDDLLNAERTVLFDSEAFGVDIFKTVVVGLVTGLTSDNDSAINWNVDITNSEKAAVLGKLINIWYEIGRFLMAVPRFEVLEGQDLLYVNSILHSVRVQSDAFVSMYSSSHFGSYNELMDAIDYDCRKYNIKPIVDSELSDRITDLIIKYHGCILISNFKEFLSLNKYLWKKYYDWLSDQIEDFFKWLKNRNDNEDFERKDVSHFRGLTGIMTFSGVRRSQRVNNFVREIKNKNIKIIWKDRLNLTLEEQISVNLMHNNILSRLQFLSYALSKLDIYNIDCFVVSKNIKFEEQSILMDRIYHSMLSDLRTLSQYSSTKFNNDFEMLLTFEEYALNIEFLPIVQDNLIKDVVDEILKIYLKTPLH